MDETNQHQPTPDTTQPQFANHSCVSHFNKHSQRDLLHEHSHSYEQSLMPTLTRQQQTHKVDEQTSQQSKLSMLVEAMQTIEEIEETESKSNSSSQLEIDKQTTAKQQQSRSRLSRRSIDESKSQAEMRQKSSRQTTIMLSSKSIGVTERRRQSKKKSQLPPEAKQRLLQWFLLNKSDPYPGSFRFFLFSFCFV